MIGKFVGLCSATVLILHLLAGCTLTVRPSDPGAGHSSQPPSLSQFAKPAPSNVCPRSSDWPARCTAQLPEYSGVEVAPHFLNTPKESLASTPSTNVYSLQINSQDDGSISFTMPAHARVMGLCWVRWFGAGPIGDSERRGSRSDVIDLRTWRADKPPTEPLSDNTSNPQWFLSREAFAKSATFGQMFAMAWPDAPSPRGLVIVQWPLSGSRYVSEIVQRLLNDGWALMAQQYVSFSTAELFGSPLTTTPSRTIDLAGQGEKVARLADQTLADQAYVVESALACMHDRYPDLRNKPTVLLGFSLGALTAPTVASRIRDQLDALVVIGGGTQLGSVFATSGVLKNPDGGAYLRLNPIDRPIFELDYLAHSRLDAYRVAPSLKGLPTLLIDAGQDGIVAPKYADQLWQRLGRPERWTLDSGHSGLFLTLDAMAADIVGWINRATDHTLANHPSPVYHADRFPSACGEPGTTSIPEQRASEPD